MSNHSSVIPAMMDMIPIFFFAFKILVFGAGMFFAIKWHYDKAMKEKEKKKNNEGGH